MTNGKKDQNFERIEEEIVSRLADEYRIIQDKIDKIGAFRFTIKGWSVTVIIGAIAAGAVGLYALSQIRKRR